MKFCSPYLIESLQYLRSLLLVRLGQTENVENQEKAELRATLLRTAEEWIKLKFHLEDVAHIVRRDEREEQQLGGGGWRLEGTLLLCDNVNQFVKGHTPLFKYLLFQIGKTNIK